MSPKAKPPKLSALAVHRVERALHRTPMITSARTPKGVMIGKGVHGVVFRTRTAGVVLKITKDVPEAWMALALLKRGRTLPGLVRYRQVMEAHLLAYHPPVFVLWRDEVDPDWGPTPEEDEQVYACCCVLYREIDHAKARKPRWANIRKAHERLAAKAPRLAPLAESLQTLAGEGLLLADLHVDNLGLREGVVTLFDHGYNWMDAARVQLEMPQLVLFAPPKKA